MSDAPFDHKLMRMSGRADFDGVKVVKATIDTIDRFTGLADVTLVTECEGVATEDVEFFYHCQYSDGSEDALKHGHRAFDEADEVYMVVLPATDTEAAVTYIVGHADIHDVRECQSEKVVVRLSFFSESPKFDSAEKTFVTVYDPDLDEKVLMLVDINGSIVPVSFPLQVDGEGTDTQLANAIAPLWQITDTACGGSPWTTGAVSEMLRENYPWTVTPRTLSGEWVAGDEEEIVEPEYWCDYSAKEYFWEHNACGGSCDYFAAAYVGEAASSPGSHSYSVPQMTTAVVPYSFDTTATGDFTGFTKQEMEFEAVPKHPAPYLGYFGEGVSAFCGTKQYVLGTVLGIDRGYREVINYPWITGSLDFIVDPGGDADPESDGSFLLQKVEDNSASYRFIPIDDGGLILSSCEDPVITPRVRARIGSDIASTNASYGENVTSMGAMAPWDEEPFAAHNYRDEQVLYYEESISFRTAYGNVWSKDYDSQYCRRLKDGTSSFYISDCKIWVGEYVAAGVAVAAGFDTTMYGEGRPYCSNLEAMTYSLDGFHVMVSASVVDYVVQEVPTDYSNTRMEHFRSAGRRPVLEDAVKELFATMFHNIKVNCTLENAADESDFFALTSLEMSVYGIKKLPQEEEGE